MILSKKALRLAAATIAVGFGGAMMSTSAFADWHRDRYHHEHHWHRGPSVVVAPAYAPPPVVYAPPATVYEPVAPPPVVGFGLNIHVR